MRTAVSRDMDGTREFECAAFGGAAIGPPDVAALLGGLPAELDGQAFVDSLWLEVQEISTIVLSTDEDEAMVRSSARVSVDVEDAALRELVAAIGRELGADVTEEAVSEVMPGVRAELADPGIQMEATLRVVREDGGWFVCEVLAIGSSALDEAAADGTDPGG